MLTIKYLDLRTGVHLASEKNLEVTCPTEKSNYTLRDIYDVGETSIQATDIPTTLGRKI